MLNVSSDSYKSDLQFFYNILAEIKLIKNPTQLIEIEKHVHEPFSSLDYR